jgi:hypothetical protein
MILTMKDMKRFIFLTVIFFIPLFFSSCSNGQNDEKNSGDSLGNPIIKPDSTAQTFAGRPLSFYLAHPQVPVVAKELYTGKIPVSGDERILALLDSLFTANHETAPFYFLTITRTLEKADGAYAESLGMTAKEYVETNTSEFIGYFLNEPLLTEKDFDEWARFVAFEIMIADENREMEGLSKFEKQAKANCPGCTEQAKQKLDDFFTRVKSHFQR